MTTAGELAAQNLELAARTVEAVHHHHLPGWRIPGTFAGHAVGADVRADICFTLSHLAAAGVARLAGEEIHGVLARLLADVDGAATHTFFSYRIAETLLAAGRFDGNPLLAGFSDSQLSQLEQAVDSSGWIELLDAGVLPRNYAAVLARCELGRVELGLARSSATLDRLVDQLHGTLASGSSRALDDSNDGSGRYDIYGADVWLFCHPLRSRLGPLWDEGFAAALDLVSAVGSRNGAAVPWGRSGGDLAAALTLELAALALEHVVTERSAGPTGDATDGDRDDRVGRWLRRADDAAITLAAAFGSDGLATAHVHRAQDGYRGPARRLQLTFDLLGKIAWAAGALSRVPPDLRSVSVAEAYPPTDEWIPFEAGRPAGVWAHRRPGTDFVVPFVGTTRSHYLPAPQQPGLWEVPVDRDLPTWTPLVIAGARRYVAGGVPARVDHAPGRVEAHWEGLPVSGRGLDSSSDAQANHGPLAASRTVSISAEGRSIVMADHLSFDTAPDAVSLAIPAVAGRPLKVEWECPTPHVTSRISVDGLAEWRSAWSELATVHQIDIEPASELTYSARVTPLMVVASTEIDHHYNRSLYEPMADRVVCRRTPVGWNVDPDPSLRRLDLLHLHWPEWLAFDDLAAHEAIIGDLSEHDIPVVWTAHNLTPHEKRPDVFDPIYQAWASAVDGVIHHSAWGERLMRGRYSFGPDCRHDVIPHGHFGTMWAAAGLPDKGEAERRLGLGSCALRIGILGAPRTEKLVQAVLDGVAACRRTDVELVCWSLGPDDVVPDDERIAIAQPYRSVQPAAYATRLAACDVLALVFDADGEMLGTGAAADSIGMAMPALRSDWGYLVETLGASGIPVGQTAESVADALDALTAEQLAAARAAAEQRRIELDWAPLADRTADLFERVILHQP